MNRFELTNFSSAATVAPMNGDTRMAAWLEHRVCFGWRAARVALVGMLATAPLGACVNVSAPDKPIVIELNINIRQEVIYRLAADAANTIEQNPEIF